MHCAKGFLTIFLIFAVLFTGVGYAQLTGSLSVTGTATFGFAEGLYIYKVTPSDAHGIVNAYSGCVLNTTVTLGGDAPDTVSFEVALRNQTDNAYVLKGVTYDSTVAGTYTNPNIRYTCSEDPSVNIVRLEPRSEITLTLIFSFRDGYTPAGAENLTSILLFDFHLYGANSDHTDYEEFISYFLDDTTGSNPKYGLNNRTGSGKGAAVESAIMSMKYVFPDTKISGGNLSHMSQNDSTGLTFVYEKRSETSIYLYTYEKMFADEDYEGESVAVYRSTLVKKNGLWESSQILLGRATITDNGSNYYIDPATWKE